jgi:UDP-2,4-diacetamido-2,4,6-trideoxy-beta-L-altropyranose hydrolase
LKKNLIIRADGGTSIGMGHIVRCLALADMLRDDFQIIFAIQAPDVSILQQIHNVTGITIHLPETDNYLLDLKNLSGYLNADTIVVIDGYNFRTEYQQGIKDKGCRLVAIDDLHSWHHVADAVINHAPGAQKKLYSSEMYTKFYLGLDYALLRKEFLERSKSERKILSVKKIFISMGAADAGNLSEKFSRILITLEQIEEIHLMLGTINPNLESIAKLTEESKRVKIIPHFNIDANELVELLTICDLCICPASSISLESCAVGIPLISGYTAANQKNILDGLSKYGSAINAGDLNSISNDEILKKITMLVNDQSLLNKTLMNQSQMINGMSVNRVKELFKDLQA